MNITMTVTHFVLGELLADDSVRELDPDYDLVANGVIDSLGVLQLMSWLREQFGVSVEDVDMSDLRSVRAICNLVYGTTASA